MCFQPQITAWAEPGNREAALPVPLPPPPAADHISNLKIDIDININVNMVLYIIPLLTMFCIL